MSQQDIIEELIKKVETLEKDLKNAVSQNPLYTILNVNTPPQITANQNNYDIGNYDLLRLSTDASHNITGFSGGVAGRLLYVTVVSTTAVVFVDNSALSSVGNRILCPTAGTNVTMVNRDSAIFVYDGVSTSWRFLSLSQ